MDVKPQRPARSRSIRVQQDENQPAALKQKTTNVGLSKVEPQKAVGGLKAAAKRTAFADVSNRKVGTAQNAEKENVIIIQDKKPSAISRPAQRAPGLRKATATNSNNAAHIEVAQQAGYKKYTKKTTVYEDRKASPRHASPKVSRDAVSKDANGGLRKTAKRRAVRPLSGIARVRDQDIQADAPVYSDEQPHAYDGNYLDDEYEVVPEAEELDDDDATDPEEEYEANVNEKAKDIQVISDYETDDDETEYTGHRSRIGDNTTGATTRVILPPRLTGQSRKEYEQIRQTFDPFDEDDEADITMVAEYGDEIFAHLRYLENKMLPDPNYMDYQSEIKWSMRAILMDWLVQVHQRFNLLPETMFLCANYIDRFLSAKVVSLAKLQLVGATALFVAAKVEEIHAPSVHEIVYMVDGGYTAEEILKAERFMLSMLQFELTWPGPMSFLRRISKADDYDLETRTLAKYLLEVTLMDERFVGSPPSYLAAGAHCCARIMLRKGDWTPAHIYYSEYTEDQLSPLIQKLIECCQNQKEHHGAVFDKYADRRFKRASTYVRKWMQEYGCDYTSSQ